MEHNVSKGKLSKQTALIVACKTGNVAAVREILEWADDDDKRVDINARDENGQNALSIAKQSNNAEIIKIIEQTLFLRAVENGDTDTVKTYLTAKESNLEVPFHRSDTDNLIEHHENSYDQMEMPSPDDELIDEHPPQRYKRGSETSKDSITHSLLLKAVAKAQNNDHDEMLNLLFNDDRFNEVGQLHQLVTEYLATEPDSRKYKAIEILLKSRKFSANVSNLQNETIFEIVCKINPKHSSQIDALLRILLQNGFALNERNKNGETFLMLACKNRRDDIVRSLIKTASRGSVLGIDAVDESFEKASMKAIQNRDSKTCAALLMLKLIRAVEDISVNEDIVSNMLDEFRNTLDICVKSWNQDLDDIIGKSSYRSDIRFEAMHLAMKNDTKHSDEILNYLVDCDFIFGQDIETGYSSLNQQLHKWKADDDKKLRLIELLLKCRKINANDRDQNGRTALHWAEGEKLISLLILYGADVSKKDNVGKTPLMPISDNSDIIKFPVLRTLLEEVGTLANLDAVDCNGRTALMHAVMLHRSHDVELLLDKGASVNLSDHLGFTALHHALYRNINDHFTFPQNYEELKKMKEMTILFDAEKHEHRVLNIVNWGEERREIVKMLLQRPDIDVNLLSFEKFSSMDIAEGQIPQIPSFIKHSLKKKGAVLNVFQQTESQSTSVSHLDFAGLLTLTLKQLYSMVHIANNILFLKEELLALIETFKEQLVVGKDQQERTAMHLFAISFFVCPQMDDEYIKDFANGIVDKLISLGCSVNETDIFGRTPLHYANEMLWRLLKSKGADASIKDKDGNVAKKITPRYLSRKTSHLVHKVIDLNNETYSLRLINNKQIQINVHCIDDRNGDSVPDHLREEVNLETAITILWEDGEYAYRHKSVKESITNKVISLIYAIAKEIERLDPRFAIRPELVGSSNEGTKLDEPNEFDFCFVLTKISKLCEVSQSPELPPGFAHLNRRSKKVDAASDFDSFFGKDEILNTEKLKWQFTTILSKALLNIESQLNFEWILLLTFQDISDNIKKVLNFEMINPLNFSNGERISIDIVPCIHIDGWWPDEAISNVSDEIRKLECNFVFDSPQELYPWVPYSESCARISFSKAESDMIKDSYVEAREAYMIGKNMVMSSSYFSKYILKNCLLYCIEASTPSPEKASQLGLSLEEMKSKFGQMDRYLWLKCLMKCHLEFVVQDFCPCYFLPTFSSLIHPLEYFKKVSFDWISLRESTCPFPINCIKACKLYRCTSNDISESSYQMPAPDPLWERFDRKQLITSLSEIAYK